MTGHDSARWIFAGIVLALVVSLLVWARGPVHHHGSSVGALAAERSPQRALGVRTQPWPVQKTHPRLE